jgi:hypothetical protein
MLLCWLAAAWAEEPELWLGAGATTGVVVNGAGVEGAPSQIETNVRVGWEDVLLRVDADLHVDPNAYFRDDGSPADPIPFSPEWAMIQFGRKTWFAQVGVQNPNFGLFDWDERKNYLPTFNIMFGPTNAQNLGVEVGRFFDDGAGEVFVYGGYDLGWLAPGGGAGVAWEGDSFATWSGFTYFPGLKYGIGVAAMEVYPTDWLWLAAEPGFGMVEDKPFGGGQFVATFFGDEILSGSLRVDGTFGGKAAGELLEIPIAPLQVGGGLKFWPTDWLLLMAEGNALWDHGSKRPGFSGTLLLDVHVPEPDGPYEASIAEEEPEEPGDE